MFAYEKIKTVQLEITNRCQAACPMCVRNIHGGIDNDRVIESDLSLENFKKIFTPEFLNQLHQLNFCGNYGENIVNNDFVAMCDYVTKINPIIIIKIHTNGSARTPKYWEEIVKVLPEKHEINFAIDGLSDTHALYRINTDYNKIIENAKAFINAGGTANWMFIRFKHNEHQEQEAKHLAENIGFKKFIIKNSRRFAKEFPVLDKRGKIAYHIEQPTNSDVRPVGFHDLKDYKSWSGLSYNCYAEEELSIFIDAFGHVYPCCIISGFMYVNYDPETYKKHGIYDPSDVNLVAEEAKKNVEEFVNDLGGFDNIDCIKHGVKQITSSKVWLTTLHRRQEENKSAPCSIMCSSKSPYITIYEQLANRTS